MKRILATLISLALVATMAIGGSIAYLTDTDSAVNVMEVGNVDIEQIELQRAEGVKHNASAQKGDLVPFVPGQKLYPAVPMHDAVTDYTAEATELFKWNDYVYSGTAANGLWNDNNLKGALDKFVFVENMGKSDAYYRTILAFECPEGMEYSEGPDKEFMMNISGSSLFIWDEIGYADISGTRYLLMVATYDKILEPGQISHPSLLQVVMTHNADNDDMLLLGDTYEILAFTQAVQTDNMTEAYNMLSDADKEKYDNSAAKYALVKAFGKITAEDHPWEDGIYTLVTNNDELETAIKNEKIKSIRVQGNLTYDWGGDSYENSKALLMKGKTFFGADKNASLTFAGYGSANPIKGVTLKDITIKDETVGDDESAWEHGYLEFEGLSADNVIFEDSIMLAGTNSLTDCTVNNDVKSWYGAWVKGGNTTFKGCTFTGTRAIKIHEAYGTEVASVTVNNCSFDLTEKPGVAIGDVNAATSVSIINSDFDCRAGDQGKYIYESDTDVTTFRFNESNNNVVKSKVEVADDNAMDAAIKEGANTLILGSGNYIIPDSAQGKVLTIVGNGDTVIATQDDGSYEGCDYSLDGATVTFENITINTDSSTYTGYARMNGTYKNCTINGTYTLYGDSTFENCTFNVSGDVYNIWTWGAPTATFENCTFNSDGKAMLLYGQANTKLTIDGCTFNDKGGLTDKKAAVEIGNDYGTSYELIVNNTTVNGYEINDKGINTGTTLWGNKNSMGTDKLNVVVDGVDVY